MAPKTLITLIVITIFFSGLYAQVLDNSKGNAYNEYPTFNHDFIKKNKIKEINGFFMNKRSGEAMTESNQKISYSFNSEGKLTRIFQTRYFLGQMDTLVHFFEYDSRNNIKMIRFNENKSYTSKHYEYDSENRIIREEFRKDIDTISNSIINPVITSSVIINFETREYEDQGQNVKMIVYNNYHNPYIETLIYKNKEGLITSTEERMKITSRITKTFYDYNEKAWISKFGTTEGRSPDYIEEKQFSYDDFGNLTQMSMYRLGKKDREIEFLYNEKTGLLGSIIDTKVESNYLTVIRLKGYKFYE